MHRTWSNRSLAFIWIVWLYVKKVGGNALSGLLEFWRLSSITFKHMIRSLLVAAPEFGISQKRSNLLHGVLDPVATLYLHVLALLLFWSVQTIPGNIPPSIITIHICTMGRILNRWLVPGERGTGWYSFHIQLLWSRLSFSRFTYWLLFNTFIIGCLASQGVRPAAWVLIRASPSHCASISETILHPLFPMETMSWFIGSQGMKCIHVRIIFVLSSCTFQEKLSANFPSPKDSHSKCHISSTKSIALHLHWLARANIWSAAPSALEETLDWHTQAELHGDSFWRGEHNCR